MAEAGIVRFQGNLDPQAQEYIPQNPTHTLIIFRPPPPLPLHPPPPPPPPQLFFPYMCPAEVTELQVVPFAGAGFDAFAAPPPQPTTAHVTSAASTSATRAVALIGVPREASETSVRRELEAFGDVRAVQMERLFPDGIVTVHFYDLRHAETALAEVRRQHMAQQTRLRDHYAATTTFFHPAVFLPAPTPVSSLGLLSGRAVWAEFAVPVSNAVPEGNNQGTIVIFNLDEKVTFTTLRDIFKPFGPIKELRETPAKKHQKFVEFFDIRDSAKALREMNGKEIHGKPIVIEFSRPGGQSRKFLVNASLTNHSGPTISAVDSSNYNNEINGIPYHHNINYQRSPSSSQPSKLFTPPPNLPPRKLPGRSTTQSFESATAKKCSVQAQFPARKPNFFLRNWTAGSKTCAEPKTTTAAAAAATILTKSTSSPPKQAVFTTTQGRSTRTKKSKHGKKLDSRFLISDEITNESSDCKDARTTVMIKNIPNKYSQKLLLNMLDNHCIHCNKRIADGREDQPLSSYDFVYLPIDFNNKCNVGYGFVNMTSPEATLRLYKAFHLQLWEAFNSRKICEVTYARVQGLEALKEHFKNSKFPSEMDHYLPVSFTPPRDGRQLSDPLPVVGPHATKPTHHHHHHQSESTSSSYDDQELLDGGDHSAGHVDDVVDQFCQNGGGGVVINTTDDRSSSYDDDNNFDDRD